MRRRADDGNMSVMGTMRINELIGVSICLLDYVRSRDAERTKHTAISVMQNLLTSDRCVSELEHQYCTLPNIFL